MNCRRRRTLLLGTALAVALACARNPVTGKNEIALVSEGQEIQMGKQAAQEVAQTMGFVNNAGLESYVSAIGMKMAKASERPDLPWEFHVVDDAAVNAFALPGGFIYVTRGLLTSINDEAELATVMGHEIGHVTHRHSVEQMSKAQLAQLGLGLGSVFSPQIAQFAGVASQGLQLLFLKYGRTAESQADELGFRYALNQNYDVREMANVFVTLERVSNEAGGGRVPEWLSTHPDPGNRVTATQARLDTLSRSLNNTITNRDGFLQHIGGLVYGADPRQGFFEGNTFYHPGMRFQITFPQGWKTQNAPTAVVGASPKQDAIIQLGLAGKTSPREAASQFLSQQGIQAGDGSTRSINGNDAATSYFQAQTEQGNIAGIVSFISYGGQTFGLLGYAGAQQFGGYESAIKSAIGSFGQLKNQDALNVKPNHVELVRLPRAMTLNEFNQEYPSTISITELAIINEMAHAADQIPQGRIVKRVTGGREVKEASPANGQ
jgi:predicted Zn-dependent protease